MLDMQKRRVQFLLFVSAIVILSMTAEKCREVVGRDSSSRSGKFTWINCFDMGPGSLVCLAKEGVKLYIYNLRAAHVERVRQKVIENAFKDALSGGLNVDDATEHAQKEGAKAAKQASQKAKRIIGPILSSGWDFFEAIYYGGSIMEGFMRGMGTLFGAYMGGYQGEQRLGRLGYLAGSQLGSWFGGRVGLMLFDVINGVHYLVYNDHTPQENFEASYNADGESSEIF